MKYREEQALEIRQRIIAGYPVELTMKPEFMIGIKEDTVKMISLSIDNLFTLLIHKYFKESLLHLVN